MSLQTHQRLVRAGFILAHCGLMGALAAGTSPLVDEFRERPFLAMALPLMIGAALIAAAKLARVVR